MTKNPRVREAVDRPSPRLIAALERTRCESEAGDRRVVYHQPDGDARRWIDAPKTLEVSLRDAR